MLSGSKYEAAELFRSIGYGPRAAGQEFLPRAEAPCDPDCPYSGVGAGLHVYIGVS